MTRALKPLAIISAVLLLPVLATAATLQARVIEVPSGNTLVVSNINRTVRIRIKAVVPPEVGQPFNETARDHLRALVFNQAVSVEYTHLAEGYLEAKVFLKGIDIGSQMLRDGVAWYDRANDYELSQADRELYAQCEQAARVEKRGLWQDQSAVAPWEYRRIQLAKLEALTSSSAAQLARPRAKKRPVSRDDFGAMVGPSAITGQPNVRPIVERGNPDSWTRFQSEEDHFSVLVPSNAVEGSYAASPYEANAGTYHFVASGTDQAFYSVIFAKTSKNNPEVSDADRAIRQLVAGMNEGIIKSGSSALITAKVVRDLKMTGYLGKQYTLGGPGFSGAVRVLSKDLGEDRQIFLVITMTRAGSENLGRQFMNSFSITQ
jgi:micrococcal nuclease